MDFVVSVPEVIGGGLLIIILNVALWIFAWGKTMGKLCERVNNVEEKIDHHIDHPAVLPDCNKTFLDIGKSLAGLEAQVKNMVSEIKDLKKRVEV